MFLRNWKGSDCTIGCGATKRWKREDAINRSRLASYPAYVAAALIFGACTSLHSALRDFRWDDQWGSRGEGVAQRDLPACVEAVETRRSMVQACMEARGW